MRLPAHKETTAGQLRRPWLSGAIGARHRPVFYEPSGDAVNVVAVEGEGSFDLDGEAVAGHVTAAVSDLGSRA